MHDALVSSRAFRVLTVIDQWSRESVLMEVKAGLTGQCVADAAQAVSTHRPLPKAITVDCSGWRSGGALGRLTPSDYANQSQLQGTDVAAF